MPDTKDTLEQVLFELHARGEILSDEAGILMTRLREFLPDDERFWPLVCTVIHDDRFRNLMVEMTVKRRPPHTIRELLEHFDSMDGDGSGDDFINAVHRHKKEFG